MMLLNLKSSIPFVLVTILVLATMALTPTIVSFAKGTNESSYKYGFEQGKAEWGNCMGFGADCHDALTDCQSPVTYYKNETTEHKDIPIMTNTTACIDGYIHAWNHICKQPQAKDNNVHCPTTFKYELINDTLPTSPNNSNLPAVYVDKRETTGQRLIVTEQQQKDIDYTNTILAHGFHKLMTWNFVNKTNDGTIIAKGIMTFGEPNVAFKETVGNKTIWEGGIDPDPIILANSDLLHALCLCYGNSDRYLYTLKAFSPDHVQLTHGLVLNDDERVSGIQNNTIDMTLVKPTAAASTITNNENSYMHGYNAGKIDGELGFCGPVNRVTNTTACNDGYIAGYKNWCVNNTKNCAENFITGDFPDIILKTHQQYLLGSKAATGKSMCPIGENAAFCGGYDDNNGDYWGQDCSDDPPLANTTTTDDVVLLGCPGDVMTDKQIGGLPALIGTWSYMNESKSIMRSHHMTSLGISGKIVYGTDGDFNLTIPLRSPFGDYTLEGSWGYIGHNILTECYAGGCENNTLTTVTPNHIEFIDNNHNIIHLKRISPPPSSSPSQPSIAKTTTSEARTVQKTLTTHNVTATVTAPQGSKIESLTVVPLRYMHLNDTWNLVDNNSKSLGQITFGSNVVYDNKWNERSYDFTGIFSGEPVKGDYSYIGTGHGDPYAGLNLTYTYHHHKVNVDGTLNIINPDHMEIKEMVDYGNKPQVKGFNYKTATGLYIHSSKDIIHLTRLVTLKTFVPLGTAREKEPIGAGV
jgi:hypothetical protein